MNASRPSEHPPVRMENVKTFRWDHKLQRQNLFIMFFLILSVLIPNLRELLETVASPARGLLNPGNFFVKEQLSYTVVNSHPTHQSGIRMTSTMQLLSITHIYSKSGIITHIYSKRGAGETGILVSIYI